MFLYRVTVVGSSLVSLCGRKEHDIMHFKGIILGALSFLIIGVWHPIVIKGEYHLGRKVCMPAFAAIGVACVALSLRVKTPSSMQPLRFLASLRFGALKKWQNRKNVWHVVGFRPIQNAWINNDRLPTSDEHSSDVFLFLKEIVSFSLAYYSLQII